MKRLVLVACVLTMTGCASAVSKHQILQAHLNKPVDCMHIEQDVAELEQQYVSGSSRFANGLATILPTSALLNLISGEYVSRMKLANGSFNEQIQAKVDQINTHCAMAKNKPQPDEVVADMMPEKKMSL